MQTPLQVLGVILLAASWLPGCFAARTHEVCPAGGKQVLCQQHSEPAYVFKPPLQNASLAQIRPSGFFWWFSKRSVQETGSAGLSLTTTGSEGGNTWNVAPAPPEFLRKPPCGARAPTQPRALAERSSIPVTTCPSHTTMWIALAFSVGVGIVAGFLPAVKAARLQPIQALRYE